MTAPASRQQRRALKRKLRRLSQQAEAPLATMRQGAKSVSDRLLIEARLYSLAEALNDPELGRHTLKAMLCAYGASQGLSRSMAECYCCGAGWSRDRGPGAVAKLVSTELTATLLALICIECVAEPSEAERRFDETALRDFFGGEGKVVPIAALPAAGHA